jgi:hypothetical protein
MLVLSSVCAIPWCTVCLSCRSVTDTVYAGTASLCICRQLLPFKSAVFNCTPAPHKDLTLNEVIHSPPPQEFQLSQAEL